MVRTNSDRAMWLSGFQHRWYSISFIYKEKFGMRIYFILKLNILKHIFKNKKNVQVRKRDVYLSISCLVFILSNFY